MTYAYDPDWPDSVPADEEAASLAGLALAPWVAVRAAAIKESHIAERRAESPSSTESKVSKWKRGLCTPRGGGHK